MTDTVTGLYRKTHYALTVLTRVNTDSIQVRTESLCGHPCVSQNLGRLFTEGKGGRCLKLTTYVPIFWDSVWVSSHWYLNDNEDSHVVIAKPISCKQCMIHPYPLRHSVVYF
jgi:hypothetical protein